MLKHAFFFFGHVAQNSNYPLAFNFQMSLELGHQRLAQSKQPLGTTAEVVQSGEEGAVLPKAPIPQVPHMKWQGEIGEGLSGISKSTIESMDETPPHVNRQLHPHLILQSKGTHNQCEQRQVTRGA